MGLIRSANSPQSAAPFSLRDIEAQAQAILLRAQQKAEQLLAAAQEESQRLRDQARQQGHDEGHRDGTAKGLEQGLARGREQGLADQKAALTSAVAALNKATGAIEQSRRTLETDGVEEVLRLAIAIARRVTKRLGEIDPAVAVANVTDALKLAVHAADVRITINPTQKTTIEKALQELRLRLPDLEHVTIREDASIDPGGCRIVTSSGAIDATLDTQLERIIADLLPDGREADHGPV